MRGKGVPKIDFFLVFFVLCLGFREGSKIGSNLFIIFGLNFGFLFLGTWIFRVSFGSHLGPLEAFLRCVCSQKPLKKHVGFLRFLEMKVFGSLKLLMVLLGSSWPSWAALIPNCVPKWVSAFFKKW